MLKNAPDIFSNISEASQYMTACEDEFRQQVIALTKRLLAHPELRLIGLSGPTCAGKTTAASIITEQLESVGRNVHIIYVDDFFREQPHGRELMKDPDGAKKLDFDSIDALDFQLFSDFMDTLMKTGRAMMPRFNIGAGVREGFVELNAPRKEDIFLIEGIQVVYPEINALLCRYNYRSIFIRPEQTLCVGGNAYEPNEVRLLRRLVRDYYFRSSDAAFTFFAWDSVRENEEKSIFPYAEACDEQLDSLMGYEIGILRPHLENILSHIPSGSVYRSYADSILSKIATVQPLKAEWLPPYALYREFVPYPGRENHS
jgi:uridine kinase